MPVILQIFLTLTFYSGFYYLGKFITNIFSLKKMLNIVSELNYQYAVIGISFFIFFLYPLFFFLNFTSEIFFYVSILILFCGTFQIIQNYNLTFNNIKNKITYFKNEKILKFFFLLLITLYFLISLCPPTSGDSVAYHLSISKYILQNGFFPENYFDFEAKLSGSGEFFNAFVLSINAYQFSSFLQFIGLFSIYGILKKNCEENKLEDKSKFTLYLFLLSCPMLIFLISTSKPQFFYVSLAILSFSYLFKVNKGFNKELTFKILIFCNIILLTATSAKINFTLSLFAFNLIFFINLFKKKILIRSLIFLLCLYCFSLLPSVLWKAEFYNFPFYNFLINPLPLNLPGYDNYHLFLKDYDSDKFPWLFFFPSSLGAFTNTLGLATFLIVVLLFFNYKGKIKFLLLLSIFLTFLVIFGQKSPRFFIEIYILIILLLPYVYKKFNKNFIFIGLKYLIFFQSFIVALSLAWGVFTIFPANFNNNFANKVFIKYVDGFSLYYWVNSVLPKNESIIVDHRSTFLLDTTNYMNTSALTNIEYDNKEDRLLYLTDIKKFQPEYILFRGNKNKLSYGEFNFENCLNELFAEYKDVGRMVARNPFNIKPNQFYDAYIYKINFKNLPYCVKKSVN